MEPTNPTVLDLRQNVVLGDLSKSRRHKSQVGVTTKDRSKVLFPGLSRNINSGRQQQALPDRRYALNNVPEHETMYYHQTVDKPVTVKDYVYRKHGVPYIPAWKVLNNQVGVNFFDANPNNSTDVAAPDLYYQQQDRDANPRTMTPNVAELVYNRQMEVMMTNHLLRHMNEWNRHMIRQYSRQYPDRFYKPLYADEIKADDRRKFEEKKKDSEMLRDVRGKFVRRQ
jgi:hypothetical protein